MKTPAKSRRRKASLKHYVNWFEIPVLNFERALRFYNVIYDIEMETTHMNGYDMGFFPANKGIGGAIVMGEGCVPSDTGPLIYLNGGKDLSEIMGRVGSAGGRIILPKTLINESAGFFALFLDTEGNRMAIHSKT